jgi:hypothetical protein
MIDKDKAQMVEVSEGHFFVYLSDPTPEQIEHYRPLLRALDKTMNTLISEAGVDKYKLFELGGGSPEGLAALREYFSEHKALPEQPLVPIDALDRLFPSD